MKAVAITVFLVSMALAIPAGARELCVKRTIEGYGVSTVLTENPPVLGRNVLRVEIKDDRDKPVTNASVTVNYFMPPMPGMPPMNYTVPASMKGAAYVAQMDLIMRGPWNIVVKSTVAGKVLRMAIVIDVR